jgi:hypothetical protein
MRIHVSRKFVISAVAVFAGLTVGIAAAMWTSSGSGPGRSQARTAQSVTVSAATGTADLYPGFADGDVYFTLTNTNPYPITFTAADAGAITSSDPTGCPASLLTVDDVASGLALAVDANDTSATLSVADVVTLDASAPDACQGVSFTIALTLTGSQV